MQSRPPPLPVAARSLSGPPPRPSPVPRPACASRLAMRMWLQECRFIPRNAALESDDDGSGMALPSRPLATLSSLLLLAAPTSAPPRSALRRPPPPPLRPSTHVHLFSSLRCCFSRAAPCAGCCCCAWCCSAVSSTGLIMRYVAPRVPTRNQDRRQVATQSRRSCLRAPPHPIPHFLLSSFAAAVAVAWRVVPSFLLPGRCIVFGALSSDVSSERLSSERRWSISRHPIETPHPKPVATTVPGRFSLASSAPDPSTWLSRHDPSTGCLSSLALRTLQWLPLLWNTG